MRVLVLFAHPRHSTSIVQRTLYAAIDGIENVTRHDLYAAYPHFAIDVAREQALLVDHDMIILQHPFYWYSAPAIVKEWLDLVLELGWAYGPGGDKLHRKFLMTAMSTGGAESAYRPTGRNRFRIAELLSPFDQTAHLCGMAYLEPFVVFAGRWLPQDELADAATRYRALVQGLADDSIDPLHRLPKGYRLPLAFAQDDVKDRRHAS
jgi:glutathione-regulated potassium-efflux system ancillary protein KefG